MIPENQKIELHNDEEWGNRFKKTSHKHYTPGGHFTNISIFQDWKHHSLNWENSSLGFIEAIHQWQC